MRCMICCQNFMGKKNPQKHLPCCSPDVGLKIPALVFMNSSNMLHCNIKPHHLPLPRTLAANYHHSLHCSGQKCWKRRELISTSRRGRSICSKTRVLLTAGELMTCPNCVSLASFHTLLEN